MRDISYRAKRKDNGEWVYGVPLKEGYSQEVEMLWYEYGSLAYTERAQVIHETVGQYTGRNVGADKLFEGDIIEWVEDYDDNWGDSKTYIGRSLVIWDNDNSCWAVKTDTYIQFFNDFSWDRCYVIGNIHDNPELIEVK